MSPSPDDIARRVAHSLDAEFGPGLAAAVEARLQAGPAEPAGPPMTRQFSPALWVGVASLVVNMTKFAYDLYKDNRPRPPAEVLERRLRIEIATDQRLPTTRHERIVKAVVDAIKDAFPES